MAKETRNEMTGAKLNVFDLISSYSVIPPECLGRFTAEFWRFLFQFHICPMKLLILKNC